MAAAVAAIRPGLGQAPPARGELESRPIQAEDPARLLELDFASHLPRVAPREAADALATFTVQPGFRLELVAAEPLVADPVAIAFDENGRLFVCQMCDYSEQEQDFLGEIRMLEDTDGDGRYDKSTVYVDNLSWPTAVFCYDGGVFVGAAPDVYYCKDTDGDGRADVRETVYTGFARSNVQGLLNTFLWGLDNRIHLATSSVGGEVRRADQPEARPISVRGRNVAFDPRTRELTTTSGAAQHGYSFDDWGRPFVCSNSDHIQQVMYEDRYVARNPYLPAPSARRSIAADGPQAEVYRTSPVEPWRILRTRLRISGAVKGAVEGGGRAAGYFTGATGVTIYRGDAWPSQWQGTAVVGDVGSNLVHRKRLELQGLEFVARRVDEHSELVSSSDIWFRPAQFANAPDGTLYICDVYREVIEHPKSIPPMIKDHLDLTSGRDRGRIYRLVPEGFSPRPLPRLGQAPTAELVTTLAHPNAWHRETAARLLYERQDTSAVSPLKSLAASASLPQGRMHALYALDGLGGLDEATLLAALADEHPQVRRHAARLSEPRLATSPALVERLLTMATDESLDVRYQLAFTLGETSDARRLEALEAIIRRDAADRWIQMAVASSLAEGAGRILVSLAGNAAFRGSAGGGQFLATLATQISMANQPDDIALALAALDAVPAEETAVRQTLARALSRGLARSRSHLRELVSTGRAAGLSEVLAAMLEAARRNAADGALPAQQRIEAIKTLSLDEFKSARSVLAALLDSRQPHEVQLAALTTLAAFDDPGVAEVILAAWPTLGPRLREPAAEALLARRGRIDALLSAVEQGTLAAGELPPPKVQALLGHGDAALRDRAEKLLGSLRLSRRADVVAVYRPALALAGDVARGREHFRKICAACHRAEGVGYEIAPNLTTVKNRGAEAILLNVLDPSREVNPEFVNYTLVTDDGRVMTGMIAAETATSVTLKRAENATDTVLRVNIEELRSTGQSIMPEGLEKQLDHQAMADVIAYLLWLE